MAPKIQLTPEAVRDAVLAIHVQTRLHVSYAQLGQHLGVSESTIRRFLDRIGGAAPGTTMERVSVTKYSKSYPGMTAGSAVQWAFLPARSYLVDLLERAMKVESVARDEVAHADRIGPCVGGCDRRLRAAIAKAEGK